MKKSLLVGAICLAFLITIFVRPDTTLIGVMPVTPGDSDWQVIYGGDSDVSWVSNANLAASHTFELAAGTSLGTHPHDISGVDGIINSNGTMNWSGALFWIDAMNAYDGTGYLGFNDWRLPITLQPDTSYGSQLNPEGGYPLQWIWTRMHR